MENGTPATILVVGGGESPMADRERGEAVRRCEAVTASGAPPAASCTKWSGRVARLLAMNERRLLWHRLSAA